LTQRLPIPARSRHWRVFTISVPRQNRVVTEAAGNSVSWQLMPAKTNCTVLFPVSRLPKEETGKRYMPRLLQNSSFATATS
jgi:hypothetical protein